jgi:hypothetical protein
LKIEVEEDGASVINEVYSKFIKLAVNKGGTAESFRPFRRKGFFGFLRSRLLSVTFKRDLDSIHPINKGGEHNDERTERTNDAYEI